MSSVLLLLIFSVFLFFAARFILNVTKSWFELNDEITSKWPRPEQEPVIFPSSFVVKSWKILFTIQLHFWKFLTCLNLVHVGYFGGWEMLQSFPSLSEFWFEPHPRNLPRLGWHLKTKCFGNNCALSLRLIGATWIWTKLLNGDERRWDLFCYSSSLAKTSSHHNKVWIDLKLIRTSLEFLDI